MQGLIDALGANVELAARQGIVTARIALHPESLGQVRIHLTQTREGLVARLSAETPEAARALLGSRSELTQSLRSLGTTLLSLDINSFSQPEARNQGTGGEASGGSQPAGEEAQEASTPEEADALQGVPNTASPRGALVDVLA
jgi:flagellar hook-length control protein FliK